MKFQMKKRAKKAFSFGLIQPLENSYIHTN